MDDKSHKPLRQTSNKMKDISSTYLKHSDRAPINPDDEQIKQKDDQNSGNENMHEFEHSENLSNSEQTESLNEEKEQLINEIAAERDELKDKILRSAAELDNLRRRTAREKQEIIEYANERLLFKMLELLDDLSNAVNAGKSAGDAASVLKGIEMILQKAEKLFGEAGVKKMESPIGKVFDVQFHEALMHIASDEPEGNVVHEVLPGYMIHEKVLRHAKVVTSAGKSENE